MRRFYRNSSDGYIGGVCQGLGEYTGIDPIFWRIAFFFIPGMGIPYLLLWFFAKNR